MLGAVIDSFSNEPREVEGLSVFGASVDVIASGHSYVWQHSPSSGPTAMHSLDGGDGHSFTAQETSPSKHWHFWHWVSITNS